MSRLMPYAARFADVPRVLELLRHHPDGLSVTALAGELGVPEARLRTELTSFFLADVADDAFGVRGPAIEFLGSDGDLADAADATLVRLTTDDPLSELGVELLDARSLGSLYRAAWELSQTEPDNAVLARTVARLGETLVPTAGDRPSRGGEVAATIRRAIRQRRVIEIVYARTWEPGVVRRAVRPYRLTSTRRGYELDGAVVDRGGALRTFLVSGIREVQVLDAEFALPQDLDEIIARSRETTAVRMSVPTDRLWAVERFAERVEHVRRDDADIEVVAHVVPPVPERVGLMATIAGPGTLVVSPPDLADADVRAARRLLHHHGLD